MCGVVRCLLCFCDGALIDVHSAAAARAPSPPPAVEVMLDGEKAKYGDEMAQKQAEFDSDVGRLEEQVWSRTHHRLAVLCA